METETGEATAKKSLLLRLASVCLVASGVAVYRHREQPAQLISWIGDDRWGIPLYYFFKRTVTLKKEERS
jgi:hypothetical protein